MKQSATIINRTIKCDGINCDDLESEMFKISGSAAATYYRPEGFDDNNANDLKKRTLDEVSKDNFSIFDHGHVTLLLHTSKIMGMVLKSMGFYNITEKSARYATLDIESDVEKDLYNKWIAIFINLITSYYGSFYEFEDISGLAMENARYMTSIFTPTVMQYTVPFGRAVMMSKWLNDLGQLMAGVSSHLDENMKYKWIYPRFSKECIELSEVIKNTLGVYHFEDIIVDKLNMGVEFFRVANYILKTAEIKAKNGDTDQDIFALYRDSRKDDFYSDCYISNYKASFVAVSQTETHRELHYSIDIPVENVEPYVPKIIRGSVYEIEWRDDFQKLVDKEILPQATILEVSESGRFEDFYIKCKERLCTRSQLEITEITRDQVVKFAVHSSNLSGMNQILLGNMIRKGPKVNWKKPETIIVEPRCRFADYHCDHPCRIQNDNINYFRNI
ncbi:MAG: hypothetical protein IKR19_08660 [Acholeplasmatales bacterium]|nr:hypothetical protein [Acholeplasmatales bacterium]